MTLLFQRLLFHSTVTYKTHLYIKAGKGGVGLDKEIEVKPGKKIPFKRPGGKGGDIKFVVKKYIRGFSHISISKIEGKPGAKGDQKKSGSCGRTTTVYVPTNTMVKTPYETIVLIRDKDYYLIPGESGIGSGHNIPRFTGHITLELTNKRILGCNLTSYGCKYQTGFYTAMGKKEAFIEQGYNFTVGKKIFCCLDRKTSFNLLKEKKLRHNIVFLVDETSPDISHLINSGVKYYVYRFDVTNLKKLIEYYL